ncbi:hypothetical protein BJX62DRAFT_247255 [Aspergillus germanicus]
MDSSHSHRDDDLELLLINDSNPRAEASDHQIKDLSKHAFLYKWYSGWKFTVSLASLLCLLVFFFNLGFLVWAIARDQLKDDQANVYEGECDTVKRLNVGLHLLINVFSIILLASSNYAMQWLCSPTRKDIDSVHQQGSWLDIGVPSLHNLSHISKRNLLLWRCLALSSLPLHLVYNSTIFMTTAVYAYAVFAGHNTLGTIDDANIEYDDGGTNMTGPLLRLHQGAQDGTLVDLDNGECLDAFDTQWQFQYGGLATASQHHGGDHYLVDFCLAEKAPDYCKLQYSLPLLVVVTITNLIKTAIICYITIVAVDVPLLTVGDTVASFLRRPDAYSSARCLISRHEIEGSHTERWTSIDFHRPMVYSGRRKRRHTIVSRRQWVFLISLWLISIGIPIFLLRFAFVANEAQICKAEFGSVDPVSIIKGSWPTALIPNTIIANIPHLIFSTLYFGFNSLMTGMSLSVEWSRYALSRKGLRVSWDPQMAQRSTYFLSLPYRYAFLLMASSALLHWLISQSLYLRDPKHDLFTCGYTPVAIVISLAVGLGLLVCLIGIGARKLPSGVPVAGSCNFAIAAACDPEKKGPNRRGWRPRPGERGLDDEGLEASGEVEMLEVGCWYQ